MFWRLTPEGEESWSPFLSSFPVIFPLSSFPFYLLPPPPRDLLQSYAQKHGRLTDTHHCRPLLSQGANARTRSFAGRSRCQDPSLEQVWNKSGTIPDTEQATWLAPRFLSSAHLCARFECVSCLQSPKFPCNTTGPAGIHRPARAGTYGGDCGSREALPRPLWHGIPLESPRLSVLT